MHPGHRVAEYVVSQGTPSFPNDELGSGSSVSLVMMVMVVVPAWIVTVSSRCHMRVN